MALDLRQRRLARRDLASLGRDRLILLGKQRQALFGLLLQRSLGILIHAQPSFPTAMPYDCGEISSPSGS